MYEVLPRGFERAHHPSRIGKPSADITEEVSVVPKGKAPPGEGGLHCCLRGLFMIYF